VLITTLLQFGVSGETVPPKGYRHISIREEVYNELRKFAEEMGLTSINDAIRLLLEYRNIYSKLEYILQSGVYTPDRGKEPSGKDQLPQTGVYTPNRSKEEGTRSNARHGILRFSKQ
jgi:hypothetical protein